jgi:hypothetical protein
LTRNNAVLRTTTLRTKLKKPITSRITLTDVRGWEVFVWLGAYQKVDARLSKLLPFPEIGELAARTYDCPPSPVRLFHDLHAIRRAVRREYSDLEPACLGTHKVLIVHSLAILRRTEIPCWQYDPSWVLYI